MTKILPNVKELFFFRTGCKRAIAVFYRVAQKVSHYQMIKKSYYIVLKPVGEIIFIVKLKYESSTVILYVGIRYSTV